jgi:hypothetical protein
MASLCDSRATAGWAAWAGLGSVQTPAIDVGQGRHASEDLPVETSLTSRPQVADHGELAARSRQRRHTAVAAAKTQIDDGARSGVRRRGAVDGGTAHGFPIKPFDENRVTPRLHRPASIYTPYPI